MSRPLQCRCVTEDLEERVFRPQGFPDDLPESLTLTLDGLEALRLVDMEGLYQEAAAERMAVSRATFARVLRCARQTVSEALVLGKALGIEGGRIRRVRARAECPCPVHGSEGRRGRSCHCARPGRGRVHRCG